MFLKLSKNNVFLSENISRYYHEKNNFFSNYFKEYVIEKKNLSAVEKNFWIYIFHTCVCVYMKKNVTKSNKNFIF